MAALPVEGNAAALFFWEAHNDVNLRNNKETYYCDLGVLDSRWKDCGCGHNATAPSSPPLLHRRRKRILARGSASDHP